MRFLVCSDSHGKSGHISAMLRRAHTARFPADALCFLGDGLSDLISLPELVSSGLPVFRVRGNCDFFCFDAPEEELLSFQGHKLLLMHGHRYGVKSGPDAAIRHAISRGADILLYGHTHVPEEQSFSAGTDFGGVRSEKRFYLLNPGSIGQGGAYKNGFGVLEFDEKGVLFSRVEL